MCGRYTLVRLADLTDVFPWIRPPEEASARYNIAPSQPIPVIANDAPDRVQAFLWGLVPSWAKDPAIGNKMINARAETLAEKPAFRNSLKRRRCLIPADGFYEWRKSPSGRIPMYIRLKSGKPFAFAGLWDSWHSPTGEEIRSCTIITTTPNSLIEPIHDRMPVVLSPKDAKAWIEPGEAPSEDILPLLKPYPAQEMEAWEVSRRVNRPSANGPELVEPATGHQPGLFPNA